MKTTLRLSLVATLLLAAFTTFAAENACDHQSGSANQQLGLQSDAGAFMMNLDSKKN